MSSWPAAVLPVLLQYGDKQLAGSYDETRQTDTLRVLPKLYFRPHLKEGSNMKRFLRQYHHGWQENFDYPLLQMKGQ
jgi:hypothetical protein